MAFSGQYAAAQLGKLPLPHSVLGEISDHLGYAPNFIPPSFIMWVKMFGRLPCDEYHGEGNYHVRAFVRELSTYRGTLSARILRLCNMRLETLALFHVNVDEIRQSDNVRLITFDVSINVRHSNEDIVFFETWSRKNELEWPYVFENNYKWWAPPVHPCIQKAVVRFNKFLQDWSGHALSIEMMMNRYNRSVRFVTNFNRREGESESAREGASDSD
jgi:hypothetical protein